MSESVFDYQKNKTKIKTKLNGSFGSKIIKNYINGNKLAINNIYFTLKGRNSKSKEKIQKGSNNQNNTTGKAYKFYY